MSIHITAKTAGFLFLFVAQDLGIFPKYGYQADFPVMAGPAALAALLAGDIDLSAAIGSATRAVLSGNVPIRVIMVANSRPDHVLIGAKGLSSVEELRGKVVVAYAPQDSVNVMTIELLQQLGLKPTDYTLLNAGGDDGRASALIAGAASATLIGGSAALGLIHEGYPALAKASDYIQIPLAGLVASQSSLQSKRDTLRPVVQAVLESLTILRTRKDLVVPIMSKEFDLSPEDAAAIYDGGLPGWTSDGKPSDAAVQFEFKNDEEALGLTSPVQPEQVYDFSLLG